MTNYTPPPFPAGLAPGKSKPSAKPLQAALKQAGYMAFGVTLSDTYGPHTQDGVRAFHTANPAYGRSTDGAIGPHGWAALMWIAYGGAAKPSGEPPADYTRLYYGGHEVNMRTKVVLERARVKLGLSGELTLFQGSYNNTVAASAGTHAGGGVVDVDPSLVSDPWAIVKALREAGFAAWYRIPDEGPWGYHIHACCFGDAQMAQAAKNQVTDYFNGRDGLADNGPDSAPSYVGRPYPAWASKYI